MPNKRIHRMARQAVREKDFEGWVGIESSEAGIWARAYHNFLFGCDNRINGKYGELIRRTPGGEQAVLRVIPMCDVTYRRHRSKIGHGNQGKFADTVRVLSRLGVRTPNAVWTSRKSS
jgi:hypothetical protein